MFTRTFTCLFSFHPYPGNRPVPLSKEFD